MFWGNLYLVEFKYVVDMLTFFVNLKYEMNDLYFDVYHYW